MDIVDRDGYDVDINDYSADNWHIYTEPKYYWAYIKGNMWEIFEKPLTETDAKKKFRGKLYEKIETSRL